MKFAWFVLLTAILLLRPADIIPPLMGLPLYQGVILICIALSFGNILKQITSRSLLAHPISFCMVGLLVAIVLSHLSHMQLGLAAQSGDYFFRICLFYFLLVATIDTPERFRRYLVWLLILVGVLTALPLLQHHGVIDLPGLEAIMDRENDLDIEEANNVERLCGPGIFNDPNDLCLILVFGILLSIYLRDTSAPGMGRLLYLSPVPVFLYALSLTRSRGGLLTLAAGFLGYFGSRFGSKKAVLILLLCAPLGMLLFSGRQTDIKLSGGTSHDRVNLWREGMVLFKQYPLFGIGMDQYAENVGLVAHNSFVHAYVELGFLGGKFIPDSLRVLAAKPALAAGRQEAQDGESPLEVEGPPYRGFLCIRSWIPVLVPVLLRADLHAFRTGDFLLQPDRGQAISEGRDDRPENAAPLPRHQHGRLDCPASVPEDRSLRVESSGNTIMRILALTNLYPNPYNPTAPPSTGRSSGRWRNCTHWP